MIDMVVRRDYSVAPGVVGRPSDLYVIRILPGFEYHTNWEYDSYGRLHRIGLPTPTDSTVAAYIRLAYVRGKMIGYWSIFGRLT